MVEAETIKYLWEWVAGQGIVQPLVYRKRVSFIGCVCFHQLVLPQEADLTTFDLQTFH